MKYRKLGSTGLEVSVLGFGGSPLGSVFGSVSEESAVECVHEAIRLGVNFFDVSPYYGNTLAEKNLGKALKAIPREKFILSTKCGRYGDGFDFSAQRVLKSVDESLERLNLDYIDIIQCHDIEFGSLDQVISETIPALLGLKRQGKVRFIGITGLPLAIFRYVLDRVEPGTIDVVLSYCHYSLNDSSLEGLVPYLKDKGVGIITASPLAMGLLTESGPPVWHPAQEEIKEACAKAATHCKLRGHNISEIALKFSLSNPDIATTLVGMCSSQQVHDNVKAAEELESVDQKLLDEVKEILAPVKNKTWPSGKPENN
ncbi:hypothetical protein SELMODRAFT_153099 [Selaginella moellendorffii]|uniref:NADP-dependent oxidoreductase domain-containing protein n=1 Tax=Selaginella moellendorffii TaxID=88036 RepID=D8S6J5_SELML|nr:L-galactose dehydrogenase [Selaginella moellendorffii]EFJ19954.1 hypothetical protein SELMODRAFT_153099 [Selaginella moellendorffii]|eukprot:XP_002978997.1 L-galactose dehydrogenase [Selaginella moellendorffii]